MRKLLLALLAISVVLNSCEEQKKIKKKTILVIFAHPDDEDAIGPLLVKYGKINKVYLLIATDGRFGTRPGFPTGDTLVKLRQTESECACEVLGIEPPIFLGFTDGFDTRNGVGLYMKQSKLLKEQLTKQIKVINPDFIITFGPDGDTGHSDHRMVSNMTTEIILSEGWVEKYPLYYLAWTKRDDAKFKMIGGLNTVDSQYFNVSVKYTNDEEMQAIQALKCDKSQLSKEEIKEWETVEKKDSANTLHFRKLIVSKENLSDF